MSLPRRTTGPMIGTARYVAFFHMNAAGVSLARQRAAVTAFLTAPGRCLVGEFTESGTAAPSLDLALAQCSRLGATLLAALPDAALGTARDAARKAGIEIVAIEPGPPALDTLDPPSPVMSGDAPYLPLGRNRPPGPPPPVFLAPAGNRRKADAFVRAILPVIDRIRASGATSPTDIADALNARRIHTAQGGTWQPASIRLVLNRVQGGTEDA